MSYKGKVHHAKITSNQNQERDLVIDNNVYNISLEKDVMMERIQTEIDSKVEYTLEIKCQKEGINIGAVLPHEVIMELKDMMNEATKF